MDLMACPQCGEDIEKGGNLCGKCGSNIAEEKAERRSTDKLMFIGAVIGAIIGFAKMGFFGLIMAFPGMFLAALIPDYRKPASQGRPDQ